MKRPLAIALAIALGLTVASALSVQATQPDQNGEHQVWVCKYVGQPGDFETLKPGKNPIIVDVAAADAYVGADFADGQTHSLVIDLATAENTSDTGERYTGEATCPQSEKPSPTPEPSATPSDAPSPTPEPSVTPSPSASPQEPTPSPSATTSAKPSPSSSTTVRVMPPTDTEEAPPMSPSGMAFLVYGTFLAAALGTWAYLDSRKRR